MRTSALAQTYARSLLELADEAGRLKPVADDVDTLGQVIDATPEFAAFLKAPGLSADERQNVIDRTLAGKADELLVKFVSVLNRRGRIALLPETLEAFEQLLDEKFGKIEVDVTTATKLDDPQLAHVGRRVGEALGREAVVHQYVDPDILGGLIVRVGDKIIDASVRRQLQAMRERLANGVAAAGRA